MGVIKRVGAIYLIVIAALVGAHWIITPLYDNSSGEYPVWVLLNQFMVVAVIVALGVNVCNKIVSAREGADAPLTGRRVQVNMLFYASIVLTLWFFWNWFFGFFPQNEPVAVGLIHLEMWTLINPLFVLTTGTTGFSMWQDAQG